MYIRFHSATSEAPWLFFAFGAALSRLHPMKSGNMSSFPYDYFGMLFIPNILAQEM